MKKLAILAPLLMGQMCSAPLHDDGRLEVTPALQEACADFALSDAQIQTTIDFTEADRLMGVSWERAISDMSIGCQFQADCMTCGSAVTDQVYGR